MGSCISKYNPNVDTPDAKHAPDFIKSTANAKEDHHQATGKPKNFTINREKEESESSLSIDTRINTCDSVSDEDKEKLYEVSKFLGSCICVADYILGSFVFR